MDGKIFFYLEAELPWKGKWIYAKWVSSWCWCLFFNLYLWFMFISPRWTPSWHWGVWAAGLTRQWLQSRPSTMLCLWRSFPYWSYREAAWPTSSDLWVFDLVLWLSPPPPPLCYSSNVPLAFTDNLTCLKKGWRCDTLCFYPTFNEARVCFPLWLRLSFSLP